ncbi:hypothetical protein As57867_016899, partial [Aphanomyces stellatus]
MKSILFVAASMAAVATADPCAATDLAPLLATGTASAHAAPCATATGFSITTYLASPTAATVPPSVATNIDCQGLFQDISTAGAAITTTTCTFNGVSIQQLAGQPISFWLGTSVTGSGNSTSGSGVTTTGAPTSGSGSGMTTTVAPTSGSGGGMTTTVAPTSGSSGGSASGTTTSPPSTTSAPTSSP